MILRAIHRTHYEYQFPARSSHSEARLMPVTDADQTCLSFKISVTPTASIFSYTSPGGTVHHFGNPDPHDSLDITAQSIVETRLDNPFSRLNLLDNDTDFYLQDQIRNQHAEYLTGSRFAPIGERFREYVAPIWSPESSTATKLLALKTKIYEDFQYLPGSTDIGWGADDVLEQRAGVCQDLTHVLIACARSNGIPARYVSGYLYSSHTDGLRGDQATHAWAECLLPDGSWLGIDPTNDILTNDHHVTIHHGRDYSEVTPTKGIYIGGATSVLTVNLTVTALESYQGADTKGNQIQIQAPLSKSSESFLSPSPVGNGLGPSRQPLTQQQQQQQ